MRVGRPTPAGRCACSTSCAAAGIRVSVDDPGTGNASIEYLAALPAGGLKIDRSFITGILGDRRAEAIVRSTVDLARNLGLSVVAEGIESEQVLRRVAELGCDVGQGFLIGRPLEPEQLQERLAVAFGIGAVQLAATRAGGLGAVASARG